VRVLGVGGAGIVHELLHKTSGARCALIEMEMQEQDANEGNNERYRLVPLM
jgi:hypothetical protein